MTERIFWIFFTSTYAGGIAFFSLLPRSIIEHSFLKGIIMDLMHVPAYLMLTYFLIRLFVKLKWRVNFYLTAFIVSVIYGGLIEYLQSFVPGRETSLKDIMSNTLGTLITVFILRKRLYKLIPVKQRKAVGES